MPMLKKIIILIIFFNLSINEIFATDIPTIVIAPSKKAQSISIVGTSVTVLGEKFF